MASAWLASTRAVHVITSLVQTIAEKNVPPKNKNVKNVTKINKNVNKRFIYIFGANVIYASLTCRPKIK